MKCTSGFKGSYGFLPVHPDLFEDLQKFQINYIV